MSDSVKGEAGSGFLRNIDLRVMAPFLALALLLVLGTFSNPNFLTVNNLMNVATRSAFIAIIGGLAIAFLLSLLLRLGLFCLQEIGSLSKIYDK